MCRVNDADRSAPFRRKCHEASLRRLKEQKKAARARDNEKNSRIEELEAQLLVLQTATEEVSAALDLREQDISAREAKVKQSERRQAQVAKYLDNKERKLHEDRAAFEQLRSSVPTHTIERSTIVPDQVFHPLIVQANRNSSSSSISKVSIELARGAISTSSSQSLGTSAQLDATRAPCMVESQMSDHLSNANAVRRRAHTGNLRKRYAPISGSEPSQLPLPEAFEERKLPSEGDLHEVLFSSSKRSNIPISTRMKQLQAGVTSTCGKPASVLQSTNTNVKRQRKIPKNPLAVALPSVASQRYKTRSIARNAKEVAVPRRL